MRPQSRKPNLAVSEKKSVPCACGCGQIVKPPAKYVSSHSSRTTGAHTLSSIDANQKKATCSICGEGVSIYPRTGDSSGWRCSTKGKQKSIKSYHKNKEANRQKSRDKNKRSRLWALYRLTPEERASIRSFQASHHVYKLLLGAREGTDHCHKTGLIRGLLDWRINRAYGLLEKAAPTNLPAVLRALADFHEHPPAELALNGKRYGLIGLAEYKKKMVYGPPSNERENEKVHQLKAAA